MNILIITYDYTPKPIWGMGQHVVDLQNVLKSLGCNVKVATVNRYGLITDKDVIYNPCYGRIQKNIIAKCCVDSVTDASCLDNLHQVIIQRLGEENFVPDIIHCHGWMMIDVCDKVSDYFHVPIVTTIHFMEKQYESVGEHPHPEVLEIILEKERCEITKSETIICVSDYGLELLQKVYKGQYKSAVVIPHGTEVIEDTCYSPNHLNSRKKKKITFVGRLEKEKGIAELCEIFQDDSLLKKADLDIIGTGSLDEELRSKYKDKYNFIGYINRQNVSDYLHQSDFIIIPSLDEQFGLVAVEGMITGAVPIASNTGGLKQIIRDSSSGFLFDLDYTGDDEMPHIDKQLLKNVIETAINTDEKCLEDMRKKNYQKIMDEYTLNVMGEKTLKVFQETIERYKGNERIMCENE